jgi:hypothetical protein
MGRLILIGSAVLLGACARVSEADLLQGAKHGHPLHIAQVESRRVDVSQLNIEDSRVKSWNKDFHTPRVIENNVSVRAGRVELSSAALESQAFQAAREIFLQEAFRLENVREGFAATYVTLQQVEQGRDVLGAKLILNLDSKGDWILARSSVVAQSLIEKVERVSLDQDKVLRALPADSILISQRSILFPRVREESLKIFSAQELQVFSQADERSYLLFVADDTGEILAVYHPEQRLSHEEHLEVSGSIVPNANDDTPVRRALPYVEFETSEGVWNADAFGRLALNELMGKSGILRLKNSRLSVINNAGDDNQLQVTLDRSVSSALDLDEGSLLDERNIYYWVMAAHRWLEEKLNFREMNFKMIAMARDGLEMDNAYFNPLFSKLGAPVLAFGMGKNVLRNTSLSRDVILHEFGHAVTWKIYGMKTNYEFSAMNEGFSDYLAASITGNPEIAEGAMVRMPYLRNVENKMKFPDDFNGKYFHLDSQIFSGALWEIRKQLGDYADILIHEARLSQADSVSEFMATLLKFDDLMDANRDDQLATLSPNFQLIRKAFLKKGINSQVQFTQGGTEDLTRPWRMDANCWQQNNTGFSNINP